MTPLEESRFLIDSGIRPWTVTAEVDLASPDAVFSQGKYLVFAKTDKTMATIIKAVAPYAKVRLSPDGETESIQMISPQNGNGFFRFDIQAGGDNVLGDIFTTQDAYTTAAGATTADKKTTGGLIWISSDPFDLVERTKGTAIGASLVPPGQTLQVLFSLIPVAIATPLPARYAIGDEAIAPLKRVDFAGIHMSGVTMSKQYYDEILKARKQR